MRILKLVLENFNHIYSGLEKNKIEIDLTKNDKVLNIIIGKMGSCKSVILGHLQPFSSFGTLDQRNQDLIIIPEMNGHKFISYQEKNNIYEINHDYIWKKDHHTIKSFIMKNGEELNPSGNISSFKVLVETELGIEQSLLSLIRLGPNVTNLIDFKSTDRKNYVADRLKEVDVYQLIYKKLNEDIRKVNAKINILTSKMSTLSNGDIKSLMKNYKIKAKELEDLLSKKDNTQKEYYNWKSKSDILLNGKSIEVYLKELKLIKINIDNLTNDINNKEEYIKSLTSEYSSITDISKNIGALNSNIINSNNILLELDNQFKIKTDELTKIKESILLLDSKNHIQNIKDQYNYIMSNIEMIKKSIEGFKCEYNSTYLKTLIPQLNNINILINEISSFDNEAVFKILKQGNIAVQNAQFRINKINKDKLEIQKKLNNLSFIGKYEISDILYVPPLCPTTDCPYYMTHPFTLKKFTNETNIMEKYKDLQNEMDKLDSIIYNLSEYQIIFMKISTFKVQFNSVIKILKELKILKINSPNDIFLNIYNQIWYDYDKLIDIINKCESREKYYKLIEQMNSVNEELSFYNKYNIEDLLKQEKDLENILNNIKISINDTENNINIMKNDEKKLNEIYLKLADIEKNKLEINDLKRALDILINKKDDMNTSYDLVEMYKGHIDASIQELDKLVYLINNTQKEYDNIKIILNDIDYAQKEYDIEKENQKILKLILDASSSKEGIPLVYIQLFFRECKDTLNELISDVFNDSIEIIDFNINETDFKIPYLKNGVLIDDISKASQGERSIISLALSFSMLRQSYNNSNNTYYNIMLLDELDGPLYSDDRNKFFNIVFKQLREINGEQVFIVSHNNTFDGQPANIIMTTNENIDSSISSIIKV